MIFPFRNETIHGFKIWYTYEVILLHTFRKTRNHFWHLRAARWILFSIEKKTNKSIIIWMDKSSVWYWIHQLLIGSSDMQPWPPKRYAYKVISLAKNRFFFWYAISPPYQRIPNEPTTKAFPFVLRLLEGFQLWPVYLSINELPYTKRTHPDNILVPGLWFGPHRPVPCLFLQPFNSALTEIAKGVYLSVPRKDEPVKVKEL